MDDLAAILGMSKKTIYNVFSDKNSLFLDMVDYLFDTIKESEQKIVKDTSLSTIEKIRHILGVMPESYKEIDFEQLYLLKDKYPDIYRKAVTVTFTDGGNNLFCTSTVSIYGIVFNVFLIFRLPLRKRF